MGHVESLVFFRRPDARLLATPEAVDVFAGMNAERRIAMNRHKGRLRAPSQKRSALNPSFAAGAAPSEHWGSPFGIWIRKNLFDSDAKFGRNPKCKIERGGVSLCF